MTKQQYLRLCKSKEYVYFLMLIYLFVFSYDQIETHLNIKY